MRNSYNKPHTHTRVRGHIIIITYIHANTHTGSHTHTHAWYTRKHAHTHMHARTHTQARTHTYTSTRARAHTHTHTHTHILWFKKRRSTKQNFIYSSVYALKWTLIWYDNRKKIQKKKSKSWTHHNWKRTPRKSICPEIYSLKRRVPGIVSKAGWSKRGCDGEQ